MRNRFRSHHRKFAITTLVLMLVMVPLVALAAELWSDATLSSEVTEPTEVTIGENDFDITVWATGNLPSGTNNSGEVNVVDRYVMADDGTITPDNSSTTQLTFQTGHHYTNDCDGDDPIQGCASNPFVVSATVVVEPGTTHGTEGVLTVSLAGSPGLDAEPDNFAVGYVKVVVGAPVVEIHGFYEPVVMDEIVNTIRGNRSLPFKFNVFVDGVEMTDPSQVVVKGWAPSVICTGAATEISADTENTGHTELRYDDDAGQFVMNVSTANLKRGCWSFTVEVDGESISAYFNKQ